MRDIKDLLIENGLSGVFYQEGDAIFFLENGSFKAGLVILMDDKLSQIVCDDGRVFEKNHSLKRRLHHLLDRTLHLIRFQ